MSMVMKYKGYVGKIEYDEFEHAFHGRVVNTRDVITFVGESVKELEAALRDSVDAYLAWCAERGKAPNKPYSGEFMVRMPAPLHAAIATAAAARDLSVNEFVRQQLEAALETERREAEAAASRKRRRTRTSRMQRA